MRLRLLGASLHIAFAGKCASSCRADRSDIFALSSESGDTKSMLRLCCAGTRRQCSARTHASQQRRKNSRPPGRQATSRRQRASRSGLRTHSTWLSMLENSGGVLVAGRAILGLWIMNVLELAKNQYRMLTPSMPLACALHDDGTTVSSAVFQLNRIAHLPVLSVRHHPSGP